MKKLMLVFGTRPEAIKMACLYHELKKYPDFFDVKVCVTAQHREMLDQVLKTFKIEPDVDLNIMKHGQDLFDITSSVLLGMKTVLSNFKPDMLLVHGDTTTALGSAIAGFYSGVLVGHIEAGLRTSDIHSPFPEEFNRQVISTVADFHFAPTLDNKNNLLNENIKNNLIFVTGNTVIDSLFWVLNRIESIQGFKLNVAGIIKNHLFFDWENTKFVLITGHRRENFGDGFLEICSAIKLLAESYPDIHFVYPVHLNPNVQKPVNLILSGLSNVHLIPALDYEPFVYLLSKSYIVLTDSGGIQEEAPSLGKPVLVMRDVTERPEAIKAGIVLLVGADREKIFKGVSSLLDDEDLYQFMAHSHNPYGEGDASPKIVSILKDIFKDKS